MIDKKTITRTDFHELFAKQLFIPQSKAVSLTEIILEEVYQSLSLHSTLKVSSFGTFLVHQKSPRVGRNPKTGEEAVISARKSLSFRPSQLLRDKVNRRRRHFS
ncbi:MAG: HU family DNA-binding protein [Alphaproteobacteria bacterium]|jgi:integration host factor subunit alpha